MTSATGSQAQRRNQWAPGEHPLRSLDYGFFGPESVVWKVHTSPAAFVGVLGSMAQALLIPDIAAAVVASGGMYTDTLNRFDNTFAFHVTRSVGDSRTVLESADRLMRVHAQAVTREPSTGRRYNPNNPDLQLWVQVSDWYAMVRSYDLYGPSPLSEAEDQEYWAGCALAAELQTCRPDDVPRSTADAYEFLEAHRSRLGVNDEGRRAVTFIARPPRSALPGGLWLAHRLALGPAAFALWPDWMLELVGLRQTRISRAVAVTLTRLALKALQHQSLFLMLLGPKLPAIRNVLTEHDRAGLPERPEVVTMESARGES